MGSQSAGRVQSVTLKMIVDNDAEIKAFKPEEYWTIDCEVSFGDKKLTVSLDKVDGKTAVIHNQAEAEALAKRIGDALILSSLTSAKKKVSSRLPFTTSTMQQEAYNRFKFSTSKTQSLAQQLYEGLAINGESVGLITYMRTDSTRLSEDFYFKHAKPYILETYGQEYLGYIKAAKNSASAQDAHEAIRPTGTHRTPELVAQYVSPDQAKLYRLIYDRALASVMSDKVEEETTALFSANGLTFKVTGTRTLFKGYEAIYGDFEDDDTHLLPELHEGENYHVDKVDSEQKFTKAPARYTEAKVVKMMEEKGIGRPSTYASTIKTLLARSYVTSKGGVLTPTENGIRTTFVLNKYFPELVSTEYTANMEKKLDEIEDGEVKQLDAMNEFYGPFMEKFTQVAEKMYKDPAQPTGEMCPKCGAPLVIKKSKYGTFVACSNYPHCDYIQKPQKEAPKETGEMCPVCGRPLVERKDRKGRPFVGCSGYPKCNYIKGAENRALSGAAAYTEKDYVKVCPSCHTGHLVVKHGKKVDFLGCTNYPKCHYHEWIDKKKETK
jgi:DNA topoisomerase-1